MSSSQSDAVRQAVGAELSERARIEKQLDGWFKEHRRDGWRSGMFDGLILGFVAGVGFTFVVFWANLPHP